MGPTDGDWNGKADGGILRVSTLRTGQIVTDGQIPAGTPDLISGDVFVISGAVVENVVNAGPVTTNGQNDMVSSLRCRGKEKQFAPERHALAQCTATAHLAHFSRWHYSLHLQNPLATPDT